MKIILTILALLGMNFASASTEDLYIFSAVEGVVKFNGQPVQNATIERYYDWSDQEQENTTTATTDAKGYFKFDEVLKGKFPLYLMTEPRIHQTITVTYNGEKYVIWDLYRSNTRKNSEVLNVIKDIYVDCELTSEDRDIIPHDSWIQVPKGKCTLVYR